MSNTESSFASVDSGSASDYIPQPKKQKAVTKAIPKKAAKSKAPSKPRKTAVPRTDSVTTTEVERVESDADSEAPMAPEGGVPTLVPILNANPRKVGKKKTVEEIYQKKTQLEHILLRPDTYIGSTEMNSQRQWIYDDATDSLMEKDIQFVPGFFKIFDEVLVNAADNKIRDPTMTKIKVTIDPEQNLISVYNNGSGIPVEIHKEEKVYVPELIFGHLLTSSNYDDSEKKVVGGRNGYGAKLCNIFSTEFIVETASKASGKKYYQKFTKNMCVIGPPKITELGKGEEFTRITFRPDLSKFQMNHLNADIIGLLKRRVYDMCATVKGVSVFLNDNKLKLNNFKDYIHMYLKSTPGPDGEDLTKRLVFERVSERWEVGFIPSSSGQLQQVSFVNSISTSKGGTHVNYVVDSIVKLIQEALDKKKLKSKVLPGAIKSNMWIFVNCLIDNPSFDSQTKENMTLKPASFGSRCELTEKFQAGVLKSGIIDMLAALSQAKDNMAMVKALDSTKSGRISGIPKLEDANKAGTRESHKCTLILTEGDSAKALVMAGLTKVGRDYYGVFPLRGKLLNVRDASPAQIKGNKELINICKIIGLNSKVDNTDTSKLRYGHLMIMTDQDHDGSHIKGLLINFFDYFYPSLLTVDNFMQEFITPIVKAIPKSQQHEVIQFFTIPEYEQWRDNLANNPSAYNVKYYKGLATSDRREGIEYFSNLTRHMIRFEPMQDDERQLIDLAFNRKKADARKEWLRRFRPGTYIDQSGESITYSDFINKELIHFSMADNVRSIPSVVDGLKPGQRKVVYGCFLRPDAEVKVATLTGSITEKVAYHHGDQSLASTIIGLAQDFVGANNVNLLAPIGQFGSRTQGGKDAGAARYISTRLKPITRLLFHKDDMPLLNYLDDDGMKVEPEFFVPVMPIILLNGCDGIGTGWSTNIPSHNPADVASNLRRLMQGESPIPMLPWYLGFTGDIEPSGPNRYTVRGRITKIDDRHFEITELPIGMWTQAYDTLLEDWRLNSDMIEDFEKHHTDLSVRYIVRVSEASMAKLEREDLYAKFKLVDTISTSNLVCFDKSGHIKRYASAEEILTEFYHIRLEFYHKRKEYLVSKLMHEYTKLSNQARFLLAVISGELEMRNVAYADFIKRLTEMGFDPINTKDDDGATNSGFDYLFNMKMINMTQELAEKLIRARDVKLEEIEVLHAKSPLDLWNTDLDLFLKLWEETVDEIQLAFAQSLTEGTSCSNKKGRKVTSKPKLKKESKETKPKGLARSDSASKPAAMKPESPSHAKAEPGSPPPSKPLSRSNSTSKPKSKLIHDDSDDSDDPFKGSLSQRTGKNLPSAVKPTPKPMAKALALDKPESKPKAAPKRKDPKVSDSEEDFEMDAALPTIAKSRPRRQAVPKASYVNTIVLSSEEEEPSEAEMESVSEYSM